MQDARLAPSMQHRTRIWPAGLVVFVLSLLVYMLTLAPDITWAHDSGDGGDLVTASYLGGAAHPPGYSLYMLVGRVVAALPIGSIPYRYNLFSALAAAGAAALVAWAVEESGPMPAVAAGLALAFAPLVWSQAVITEVYALTALLAAIIIALSWQKRPCPLVLGLAFGLGLTHHLTLALFAPLVLAAVVRWAGAQSARRVIVRVFIGLLIGSLPLAYLPLTAHAPVGWGDASTPQGFWWLVSAELYRGYAFALPAAWIGPRIAAVAHTLASSFTWVGVPVGLWGLVRLWERDKWLGGDSLLSVLALMAFSVGYNTADSQVYLIPAFVVFAVWVGVGWGNVLAWLSSVRPEMSLGAGNAKPAEAGRPRLLRLVGQAVMVSSQRFVVRRGALVVMLAVPAFVLARNWSAQDLRADRTARNFVDGVMTKAPARAIVVTSQDRHTFALWVSVSVERRRSDLSVVDQDLMGYDWYRARLRRSFPDLNVPEMSGDIGELARANPGRPVCRPAETPPTWVSCEDE
jgi:hypothetical protein